MKKEKAKRPYVVPEVELLELDNEMQLLAGSGEVNTIPDSDDYDYEDGGDPFTFS